MSALGKFQTSVRRRLMSALPSTADNSNNDRRLGIVATQLTVVKVAVDAQGCLNQINYVAT
jgi:hypothetical protein